MADFMAVFVEKGKFVKKKKMFFTCISVYM